MPAKTRKAVRIARCSVLYRNLPFTWSRRISMAGSAISNSLNREFVSVACKTASYAPCQAGKRKREGAVGARLRLISYLTLLGRPLLGERQSVPSGSTVQRLYRNSKILQPKGKVPRMNFRWRILALPYSSQERKNKCNTFAHLDVPNFGRVSCATDAVLHSEIFYDGHNARYEASPYLLDMRPCPSA
jgi:hypothetical protein